MLIHQLPQWYALHVRTNCEHAVAGLLSHLGVRHFVPAGQISGWSSTSMQKAKPLFPGYLFCHTDLDRGPKLYKVRGMVGIVSVAGKPVPISEDEIQLIQRVVDSRLPVLPYGPLRGLVGVFLEASGSGQLVVSFPLLCRSIRIIVEPGWVTPASRQRNIN
jgi:transcription antitermination factor NusG